MMNQARTVFVLGLTIFMCFMAGMIAVGKLKDVDPSDIF
jgi:putative ABC transport system permease protein